MGYGAGHRVCNRAGDGMNILSNRYCDNCGWPLVQTNMKTKNGIRHLNPDTKRWNLGGRYFTEEEGGGRCPYPIEKKIKKVPIKQVPRNRYCTKITRGYLKPYYFDMKFLTHWFPVDKKVQSTQSTLDQVLP